MNNIEFDHADIYDSLDEIKLTFSRLLRIIPRSGMAFVNGDDVNCLDVITDTPAPVKTVGFAATCDVVIEDVKYLESGCEFSLYGETYFIPMPGEFNVRNAAMAACSALFVGKTPDEVKAGLKTFVGIARRKELRGEVNGVKVIDDFAHHPTAIDLAIKAIRQQYTPDRLWVVFEPRSNTTRRSIFQKELADALSGADVAIVSAVPDPEKVDEADRLCPEKLIADIATSGITGHYKDSVDEIVTQVVSEAKPGDVVAVLSNGGFEGIHEKLLKAL